MPQNQSLDLARQAQADKAAANRAKAAAARQEQIRVETEALARLQPVRQPIIITKVATGEKFEQTRLPGGGYVNRPINAPMVTQSATQTVQMGSTAPRSMESTEVLPAQRTALSGNISSTSSFPLQGPSGGNFPLEGGASKDWFNMSGMPVETAKEEEKKEEVIVEEELSLLPKDINARFSEDTEKIGPAKFWTDTGEQTQAALKLKEDAEKYQKLLDTKVSNLGYIQKVVDTPEGKKIVLEAGDSNILAAKKKLEDFAPINEEREKEIKIYEKDSKAYEDDLKYYEEKNKENRGDKWNQAGYDELTIMRVDLDKRKRDLERRESGINSEEFKTSLESAKNAYNLLSSKEKELNKLQALKTDINLLYAEGMAKVGRSDKLKSKEEDATEWMLKGGVSGFAGGLGLNVAYGALHSVRNVGKFLVANPLREAKEDYARGGLGAVATTALFMPGGYFAKGIYDYDKDSGEKGTTWQRIDKEALIGGVETAAILAAPIMRALGPTVNTISTGVNKFMQSKPILSSVYEFGISPAGQATGKAVGRTIATGAILAPNAIVEGIKVVRGQEGLGEAAVNYFAGLGRTMGELAFVGAASATVARPPIYATTSRIAVGKSGQEKEIYDLYLRGGKLQGGGKEPLQFIPESKQIAWKTKIGDYRTGGFGETPLSQVKGMNLKPYVEIGNKRVMLSSENTLNYGGKTYKLQSGEGDAEFFKIGGAKYVKNAPDIQISEAAPWYEKFVKQKLTPEGYQTYKSLQEAAKRGYLVEGKMSPSEVKALGDKLYDFKSMNREGAKEAMDIARLYNAKIYGSHPSYVRTMIKDPKLQEAYRGLEVEKGVKIPARPGDADLRVDVYTPTAEKAAKEMAAALRAKGNNVIVARGSTGDTLITTVKVNPLTGKVSNMNTIDIHPVESPEELASLGTVNPQGAFGVPFTGRTTPMGKYISLTQGEQLTGKFSSVSTLRQSPSGQFYIGPKSYRGKDIPDVIKELYMGAEYYPGTKFAGAQESAALQAEKYFKSAFPNAWTGIGGRPSIYPAAIAPSSNIAAFTSAVSGATALPRIYGTSYETPGETASPISSFMSPSLRISEIVGSSSVSSPFVSEMITSPSGLASEYVSPTSPSIGKSPSPSQNNYYYNYGSESSYPSPSPSPSPSFSRFFDLMAPFPLVLPPGSGGIPGSGFGGKGGVGSRAWSTRNKIRDLAGEWGARMKAKQGEIVSKPWVVM